MQMRMQLQLKHSHSILEGFEKNGRSNETCFPFKLLDCDNNWEVPAGGPVVVHTAHQME